MRSGRKKNGSGMEVSRRIDSDPKGKYYTFLSITEETVYMHILKFEVTDT